MDDPSDMGDDEFGHWLAGRTAAMTQDLTAEMMSSRTDEQLDAEVRNCLSDTRPNVVDGLNPYARAFFAPQRRPATATWVID